MIFITTNDLKTFVKDNVINDITENDSTLIDSIEMISIQTIDSYIGHYYDTDTEWKKTGTDRNTYLIQLIIDIMLYHLSTRLTPTQIPETRQLRYNNVILYLKDIASGKIVPQIAKRDVRYEDDSEIRLGSNQKNNFYF